jgi:hypothetical protein
MDEQASKRSGEDSSDLRGLLVDKKAVGTFVILPIEF